MTDTTDVLLKWRDVILAAVNSWDIPPYQVDGCIRELAAEVSLLTTRLGDEQLKRLSLINECQALREKLALQEPDATLGRLVREGREPL